MSTRLFHRRHKHWDKRDRMWFVCNIRIAGKDNWIAYNWDRKSKETFKTHKKAAQFVEAYDEEN